MRAISSFNREAGISTFWCRAWSAFRTRVSMSATGSVNLIVCFSSCHPFAPRSAENLRQLVSLHPCCCHLWRCRLYRRHPERRSLPRRISIGNQLAGRASLPRRLRNSWNLPAQRELAEAQAANAELAQKSARPSAKLAAVVLARGKLRLLHVLCTLVQSHSVFNPLCCRRHIFSL